MSEFVWTEAMSVGVPALDADHRCLVRIINLLHDAEGNDTNRVIDTVMEALNRYARFHFAREEQVMLACGFPALGVHRAEHAGFSRMLETIPQRPRGETAARELLDYLKDWLLHHILIQDMAYKPYIAESSDLDEITTTIAALLPPIEVASLIGETA